MMMMISGFKIHNPKHYHKIL